MRSTIESLAAQQATEFCRHLWMELTISARAVWSDERLDRDARLEALKALNEMQHCTWNAHARRGGTLAWLLDCLRASCADASLLQEHVAIALDRALARSMRSSPDGDDVVVQAPAAGAAAENATTMPSVESIPFSVQRIDHVVFRVGDLRRSIAFYRAVLGCDVVRAREHLGLVHLRAGASMIDLVSVDGALGSRGGGAAGDEARNVDHLCLRIEPFVEAELVAHLGDHGVATLGAAEVNFGAEGDGQSLYFRDPDGNVIELKGPASDPVV